MDVLKKIIIKLQKRVLAGAATLQVKVKAHRGDPLNEETDRWDNAKNKRRSDGTTQPTGQSTDGM